MRLLVAMTLMVTLQTAMALSGGALGYWAATSWVGAPDGDVCGYATFPALIFGLVGGLLGLGIGLLLGHPLTEFFHRWGELPRGERDSSTR